MHLSEYRKRQEELLIKYAVPYEVFNGSRHKMVRFPAVDGHRIFTRQLDVTTGDSRRAHLNAVCELKRQLRQAGYIPKLAPD